MAKNDYKLWRISDFSRGQIEKLNDNVIPDNAAYEMRNFIPDRVGGLSLRKGKTLLGTLPASIQGLHPYYVRSTGMQKLIAMSAGEIYIYDDNFVKLTLEATGVVSTTSAYATLSTDLAGDNNDLVYTAKTLGTAGNAITVAYINPLANDQLLSVVVTVKAIVVNLATGPAGAITTIASDISTAIAADVDANALVSVANKAANDGSGLVIAMTATNLTGGVEPTVSWVSGDKFNSLWAGEIRINSVDYTIASITSDSILLLSDNAGVQTNVVYSYYTGGASILGHPKYPLYGTALWGEPLFNETDGTSTIFPLDINQPVLFEDCVNYTVAMNGVDAPWKYDGTYFTWLANAPAKGRYPVLHKEKLFCVDADTPSTLEWSDSFAPETWTPTNYWDIRKGDGDEITNLTKFVGDLIVFKQRSIHVLKGTSLDDFALNEVSTSVGCAGPRASVVHNLKVYFVGEQGIHITNGMNVINISEGFIPDLWARVNHNALHKAVLTAWDNKIWIALPIDSSMINNLVLMYDPEAQAYYPMDSMYPSCFATFDSGTGAKLYSGSHDSGKVGIENTGYTDFGTAITAYWRGKYFDMGIPEIQKKARKIFVQDSNGKATVDIAVSVDYGDYNNLEYYRTEGLSREYNFTVDANRWRYVSPMISCTASEACEIRGIAIPFRPKGRLAVRE